MSARSRRLTAIVACTDDSGRVLLVKQIGGPYAGAWLLPGGGVDEGESIEEGLRREMREETGLELDEITRVATYEVDERTQDFKALVHLFRATPRGQARAEDGSAIRWASPTESGYHPALRRELADAGICSRTRGWAASIARTAVRSAPVPLPWTTRRRSMPATAASLR